MGTREVTEDMLILVASYIGDNINPVINHFNIRGVSTIHLAHNVESFTWEEFVCKVHEHICAKHPEYSDDNIRESSFNAGIKWLKDQRWRES